MDKQRILLTLLHYNYYYFCFDAGHNETFGGSEAIRTQIIKSIKPMTIATPPARPIHR